MTLGGGACGFVCIYCLHDLKFFLCFVCFVVLLYCCYNHVVSALFACLPFSFVFVRFFFVCVPLYRKGCFPMGGMCNRIICVCVPFICILCFFCVLLLSEIGTSVFQNAEMPIVGISDYRNSKMPRSADRTTEVPNIGISDSRSAEIRHFESPISATKEFLFCLCI